VLQCSYKQPAATSGSDLNHVSPSMYAQYSFWQNKQGLDEQHRLQAEKMALIDTVKKLNREVAKLESFKKSLLQHLQEDDEVCARVLAHIFMVVRVRACAFDFMCVCV